MAGQEGNDMKIYVIGTVNGKEFAGHMTKQDANWMLDTHREVSKAEYRAARAAGGRAGGADGWMDVWGWGGG